MRACLACFLGCLLAPPLLSGCRVYEVRRPEPFTAEEIIRLSKEGTPPEAIIDKIRASGTIYILDPGDILDLHEKGVDRKVLDEMWETYKRDLERRAYYGPYWDPYCWPPYGPYHHHMYFGPYW